MIWVGPSAKITPLTFPKGDKAFPSKRIIIQYVGNNCRPDVCAPVQVLEHGNCATTKKKIKNPRTGNELPTIICGSRTEICKL